MAIPKVAEYTYDSWGNVLTATGTLANINPFRYRSYYRDNDTGFYYLQSRYYDPAIGRFINADRFASTGQDFTGFNMFAYCRNNPINMYDQSGNLPQWAKDSVKRIAKNIVKPVAKAAKTALATVDLTYSTGINISGSPSFWIFNAQVGVSVATKGNVAIQASAGGGLTAGSPSLSLTGYKSVTNAISTEELLGPYYQLGGSIGVPIEGFPLAAGGDFMLMEDKDKKRTYIGMTCNVGIGTPGGELHVEWGETFLDDFFEFNIFDAAGRFYTKIMEW